MQIAQLPGAALHWREDGAADGPPVIFANSLGTDLRLWEKVLPLLPPGLRIIRFDNRGHGLSSRVAGAYAMSDLVGDAAALLESLDVRDAVFVGLSIGGMIAQGLAAERPELTRALVLSNTAARMGTDTMWRDRINAVRDGGITAIADTVLERWFTPEFRAGAEFPLWRNMLLATPVEGYLGCCHALARADLTQETAKLRLPVCVIAGDQDGSSPPEQVKQTADLIPEADFHVIENAGHLPCVEQPVAFARLVKRFVEDLGHV